ncbi:hypothetical protein D9M70_515830 [compost metagenome]
MLAPGAEDILDRLVGEVGLQVLQLDHIGDQVGGFLHRLGADPQRGRRAGEVEAGGEHGVFQQLLQLLRAVVGGEDGDRCRADVGADHHGLLQLLGGPFDEVLQGGVVEFDALGGAGERHLQGSDEGERTGGVPVHGGIL